MKSSRPEKTVLLRHPCIYEEMGEPPTFDSSFEDWGLLDNPKYMTNPVQNLMERLPSYKRLLSETQEYDKAELMKLLNVGNPATALSAKPSLLGLLDEQD